MPEALMLLVQLGKWRYFISGTALAVLFGTVCRAAGRLLAPFGEWRSFSGTCESSEPHGSGVLLTVRFSDSRRLHHKAAYYSDLPEDAALAAGEPVRFAIRSTVFAAGAYPQSVPEVPDTGGDILPYRVQRRMLRRALLHELLKECAVCGIAAVLFFGAMRICFK